MDPPEKKKISSQKLKSKKKIVFNAINTEYEIVKRVAAATGYTLSYSENEEWDIFWNDLSLNTDLLCKMRPYQKINHFPGMMGLCKKNNLGRNINKIKKLFPKEYNFVPLTWLLPSEWNDLKKFVLCNSISAFIVKPEGLSQGKGIYITSNIDTIEKAEHCVVQRYIIKPYLIDGLKFDLRIYVLVNSCDPLRIYIYKEGIARFCTEKYVAPSKNNMANLFMHLTNYAINKESSNFIFSETDQSADKGHKRSLDAIWNYIDCHGGNSSDLRNKIYSCIVKTIITVQPSLSHYYKLSQPSDYKNDLCFEILGFDVIIDHRMKPYILEVNHAPSFNIDSSLDENVKTHLLTDTFKMLNMDYKNRAKYYKNLQNINEAKMYNAKRMVPSKDERIQLMRNHMKMRDEYESKVMGGYTLAYPSKDCSYNHLLEGAKVLFDGYSTIKKDLNPYIEERKASNMHKRPYIKWENIRTQKPNNKLFSVAEDKAKHRNKYLSHMQPTRSPTPERNGINKDSYTLAKDWEERSMQLTTQNSLQENSSKVSRIYISTPLSSKPEIKPLRKKIAAAKDKYKKYSYSIVNWTELKSLNDLEATSMTIYNYNFGGILPKIREAESIQQNKRSENIMDKKRNSGNYIPPKILRFHPLIGLKPETIHIIG